MNPVLPDEAVEFGAAAAKAFGALGGVDVARRAEDDPTRRATEVAETLDALGVADLDPRVGADELAAAATLCEAAGRTALPYPVAAVLAGADGIPFAAVPEGRVRVDHGDLFGQWRVGGIDGTAHAATSDGAAGSDGRLGTRLGPFVVDLVRGESLPSAPADVLLFLTLQAWEVLGTLDRAVELAVEHVNDRIQFGKPISTFQSVQFQLADCAVATAGLRELAGFTLWRLATAPSVARADVLALRVHALDVARPVLRICQQLHGAAGVCDEYDISVLARHVQPALRLPWSAERTVEALAGAIRADGFDGLFSHGRPAG